jgi:hypothetical protein
MLRYFGHCDMLLRILLLLFAVVHNEFCFNFIGAVSSSLNRFLICIGPVKGKGKVFPVQAVEGLRVARG